MLQVRKGYYIFVAGALTPNDALGQSAFSSASFFTSRRLISAGYIIQQDSIQSGAAYDVFCIDWSLDLMFSMLAAKTDVCV